MKFDKLNWERKEPPLLVTEKMIHEMVYPFFPNDTLISFEFINSGLGNTNIRLNFTESSYVLRIYTRDRNALQQEVQLSEHFGQKIPMPEFVHVAKWGKLHPFVIQKWVHGKPLHYLLDTLPEPECIQLGVEVAKTLSLISKNTFPKGGFFKENLEITPFETESNLHPFVAYIKDCLFNRYAGKKLGESLVQELWQFVLAHQTLFSPLEPACLVHGDFNPDNIIINEKTLKVACVLDWEFAFAGSYLFDIGTLLRWDVKPEFESAFVDTFQAESNQKLPTDWRKIIKVQDLGNLIGLINFERESPNRLDSIKKLITHTMSSV